MKRLLMLFGLALAVAHIPVPACPHTANLDMHGCHLNPLHGGYHCHSGPLAGRSFMSKSEAMTAVSIESQVNRQDDGLVPMFQRVFAELGLMSLGEQACR